MNRLVDRFARKEKALIVYLTAGDPALDETADLVRACARGGADVIELGVPFSDPSADGVVIQRAMERALVSIGKSVLEKTLGVVRELRRDSQVPLVLFGYFNPIFQRGLERFAKEAAEAGADGLLVVDLPPEESAGDASELDDALASKGLVRIPLLAPTTPLDRARAVSRRGGGFAYYVALTGVTGAANLDVADVARHTQALRAATGSLPICVGFGVRSAEDVRALASLPDVDGIVVGSALIKVIAEGKSRTDRLSRAEAFVRSLKSGLGPWIRD